MFILSNKMMTCGIIKWCDIILLDVLNTCDNLMGHLTKNMNKNTADVNVKLKSSQNFTDVGCSKLY